MYLFDFHQEKQLKPEDPLVARMRSRSFVEFVGQECRRNAEDFNHQGTNKGRLTI